MTYHHVVGMYGEGSEVSVHDELTVVAKAVDAIVKHRYNKQLPVWQPAKPRGLTRYRAHALLSSVFRYCKYGTLEEVRIPESALMPPRALTKIQPVYEKLHSQPSLHPIVRVTPQFIRNAEPAS
jgi:hypothetical protein